MSVRAFLNARIVDPASGYDGPGGVLVEGERIMAAGAHVTPGNVPAALEAMDCTGKVIAPGLIDMRTRTGEPGAEHKETIASAARAAAAGGVTTMVLQPSTHPPLDDPALLAYALRRGRETAIVRVEAMGALTKGREGREMAEFGLLQEAGARAFTDGDRMVTNGAVMRRALSYAQVFDALIVAFAEDPTLATGVMNEGQVSSFYGLPGNPAAAESIAAERDLRILALTGGRYHLAQVSAAETLDVLRRWRDRGVAFTVGVSAQHLALNENDTVPYRTFFKIQPPLRTEADRQALVAGLAEGLIDVVASCHEPQDEEMKRKPFDEAAYGAAGLETLLPVLLNLHHSEGLALIDALATATSRPAEILGLEGGRLAPGAPADLVVIDPDEPWILKREELRSKSTNTPYEDRKFTGRAQVTVVGGQIVFDRRDEAR